MGFMAGKRALIVGLASNRSIAWGIAQAFAREGAELAFTYQNDKLKPRVEKMAGELGSSRIYPLDVAHDSYAVARTEVLFEVVEHRPGVRAIRHELALHDLTGFDGRCDAIFFTKSEQAPPNDSGILSAWRRKHG